MDKIYTIHTIRTALGGADSRTPGWYTTLEQAQGVVDNNIGDIWEFAYRWVVIEEIPSGLYPYPTREWWYRWNEGKQQYLPHKKPDHFHNSVNFAIG